MCGIIGYIGLRPAQPILLNCLGRLEYRGYDSCGIAVAEHDIKVYKDAVRVTALKKTMPRLEGKVGIGHTRWATHGEPSPINAHPHLDCTGNIAVVHNGIITNYPKLRDQLTAEGHRFVSETDTEVIPHLIEKHYNGNLEAAVAIALNNFEGSYAIIVLAAGEDKLVAARKDSPIIISLGDRENFIASDVPAILDYSNRVVYLEDGDIGVITTDSIKIRRRGNEVATKVHQIAWTVEDAQKAGYEHFMLKEIHEQPKVIRDTLAGWVSGETLEDLAAMWVDDIDALLILACGTSYHAALIGKQIGQELLGMPVRAEFASEFNYSAQPLARTIAITITQSGETADTLKAMKKLKEVGSEVLAITNVVGSTATRIADRTLYTCAGPEISVAATKSFTAQLMVLYQLMLSHPEIGARRLNSLTKELRQLPNKVQQVLDNEGGIAQYAGELSRYENVFFIGRGINFPVALEGALKLKEIAYIHSEGYAAGELKHGPFALLDSDTPVIALLAQDDTYEPMMTNIKEVKARGSPIIALSREGDEDIEKIADKVLTVPQVETIFSPVVNTVSLQLLAYYAAKERGCSIDFPRNLAKSVTVE